MKKISDILYSLGKAYEFGTPSRDELIYLKDLKELISSEIERIEPVTPAVSGDDK